MPELPEVQTIVDDMVAAGLIGRRITRAKVNWPRTIAMPSAAAFCDQIRGSTFEGIERRAKFILMALDKGRTMIVHLRMTGRFQWSGDGRGDDKHIHVRLILDDGRALCFHDTRKFGRFYLVQEPRALLGHLGPEPLSPAFTVAAFRKMLKGRQRQLKPLLLDQTFLAGLGNIYVDEALWAARIHPLRRACELRPDEVAALHAGIGHVLRQGLRHAGTTLGTGRNNFYSLGKGRGGHGDHLKVFRRTGAPCPRCRTTIRRIIVAQRSSHVCEQCQPLSDVGGENRE